MTPVTVPWTDVNSESAILVAWHVPDRSPVRAAGTLADVETTKAALEIEAPVDGVVLQLVAEGGELKLGEPIAYVFSDQAALDAYEQERMRTATPELPADSIRATAKARQRAEELSVDLATVHTSGLITVTDVEAAAAAASDDMHAERVPGELPLPLIGDGIARRLLLVGAGLGATQVADILAEVPLQMAVAVVDDNSSLWRRLIRGIPVVGGSDRIAELWEAEAFDAVVITISTSVQARARLRELCRAAGVPLANVIDPRVKVSTGVVMGEGNVICAFVHLGTETRIGDNNFISAYNSYDHHNVLGSDISTGPGCMTSGEVEIGDRVRMGTGIFVEPKLTIGEGSIVASGAIIVRSVPAGHAVKTRVVTTTVVPLREH